MNDRARGLEALRIWYDLAGMALRGYAFDQIVANYDAKSPTFISALGGAVRVSGLSTARLQDALAALAAQQSGLALPFHGSFFDALAGERLRFRFDDAKAVAVQTVQDVANVAKAGLGIYVAVLAVGALLLFVTSRKGRLA